MRTTNNDGPVGDTFKRVAAGAHDAADKVSHATAGAAESLGEASDKVCDVQQEWSKMTADYVQENPLKALGMAVAGGMLLSRLFGSSKPSSRTRG